ncbi:MAG: hypothetical protein MZW92_49900 [Comamonadaceae bacterium]|nr:hypothetical protein [Comamonadaceae bacterium]
MRTSGCCACWSAWTPERAAQPHRFRRASSPARPRRAPAPAAASSRRAPRRDGNPGHQTPQPRLSRAQTPPPDAAGGTPAGPAHDGKPSGRRRSSMSWRACFAAEYRVAKGEAGGRGFSDVPPTCPVPSLAIDLDALRHNLGIARRRAGTRAPAGA